jgi:ATP-binding cassette subfamily B protein
VPHALTDKPGARDLEVTEGEISFDDVHFAYGGRTGGVSGI